MSYSSDNHSFRKETMYSLREGARYSLRSLGSPIWREIKSSYMDLGIPRTLCNFLDYDDFAITA